jgi:hypothetical protein
MFSVGISVFGILAVLLLALNPPIIHENFFWRKPLIGSVFGLICTMGIFAAFFPKQCLQVFHFRRENIHFTSHRTNTTSHHPDCKEFSAHVIQINTRTLCAACSGLFLGALIALVGTVLYFFFGWRVGGISFQLVLVGVIGLVLGFVQLRFRSFSRLTLNASFVLGAFLILVGIDELTESLFIDLFLTAFVIFWIFTRIHFSQWDHWRICSSCKSPCEVRGEEKVG